MPIRHELSGPYGTDSRSANARRLVTVGFFKRMYSLFRCISRVADFGELAQRFPQSCDLLDERDCPIGAGDVGIDFDLDAVGTTKVNDCRKVWILYVPQENLPGTTP